MEAAHRGCTLTAPGDGPEQGSPTRSRIVSVCALLNAEDVAYAVVGGSALALHGAVRATKDIDILLEPTLENVTRALRALEGLTFGIARDLDPAAVLRAHLTVVPDVPRVDLLTLAWSVRYADAAPGLLRLDVDGVEVPVVDLDTLIRSKQTGRLQDAADVETLERLKELGEA